MTENTKVICNHLGCSEEVEATLEFACGGSNEETSHSCGNYFCNEHRQVTVLLDDESTIQVCEKCEDYLIDSGEWYEDPVEQCLVKLAI